MYLQDVGRDDRPSGYKLGKCFRLLLGYIFFNYKLILKN